MNTLDESLPRKGKYLLIDKEVETKRWVYPIFISLGSLLVAFISLCVSLLTLFGVPGEVTIGKPAGYGIIRGKWHSDHLFLPMEWYNPTKYPVVITCCNLILTEINAHGKEIERGGENYKFLMAGEYSGIQNEILKNEPIISSSFILPGESCTKKILLFHNDKWWCSDSPLFRHNFNQNKRYRVKLEFNTNGKENKPLIIFGKLPILGWEKPTTKIWEFWYKESFPVSPPPQPAPLLGEKEKKM